MSNFSGSYIILELFCASIAFGGIYSGVPQRVEVLNLSLSVFLAKDLVIDSVNKLSSFTKPKSAIFNTPFCNNKFSG